MRRPRLTATGVQVLTIGYETNLAQGISGATAARASCAQRLTDEGQHLRYYFWPPKCQKAMPIPVQDLVVQARRGRTSSGAGRDALASRRCSGTSRPAWWSGDGRRADEALASKWNDATGHSPAWSVRARRSARGTTSGCVRGVRLSKPLRR